MPIRPEWRHFYRGPHWKAVRARILARAGNRCERCGAPNHKTVLRQFGWWTPATLEATVWAKSGRFVHPPGRVESNGAVIETVKGLQFIYLPWRCQKTERRCCCFPNTGQHRWVYIVLTIAHLNHVAGDDRDENLQALCQWCHLHHDVRFHHANARRTRAARVGQLWLTAEMEVTT